MLPTRDERRRRSRRDKLQTSDSKGQRGEESPPLVTGAKINFKAAEVDYPSHQNAANTSSLDHVWPGSGGGGGGWMDFIKRY